MIAFALALFLTSVSPVSFRVAVAPAESLSVTIAGEGTPVALIPGLFGGAFTFRNLVPQLVADGYRPIVIEPLGMGASSRPHGADYSLTAQSDRIAAVLDSLATGSVIVLAHSLGGSIAFRLAYRRPALVRGIVSLEGGPTEEATTAEFRHAMRYAFLIRLIHGVGIIRGKIHGGLRDASGDTTWITPEVVRGYTTDAQRDLGGTLSVYQAIARATEPDSLAPHLAEIACPVRLVVGTAPHVGDVSEAEIHLLENRLASFVVDSVPGAGHYLQEERADLVVASLDRLRQMLDTAGARAP